MQMMEAVRKIRVCASPTSSSNTAPGRSPHAKLLLSPRPDLWWHFLSCICDVLLAQYSRKVYAQRSPLSLRKSAGNEYDQGLLIELEVPTDSGESACWRVDRYQSWRGAELDNLVIHSMAFAGVFV